MAPHLPEPVEAYFASEKSDAPELLSACFTADATVVDEGRTHVGLDATSAWKGEAKAKTRYTVEPMSAVERDGQTMVSAEVAGAFPNSPLTLQYHFEVRDDRIFALVIHG